MQLRTSLIALTSAAVLLSACAESDTLKHMDAVGAAANGGDAGSDAAGSAGESSGATGGSSMGGSAGEPGSGGADTGSGGTAGAGEGAAGSGAADASGGAGNAEAGAGGSPTGGAAGSGATGAGGGAITADSCPGEVVNFYGSGNIRTASVSGTTIGAVADLTGTCSSTGTAADVVYAFTPDIDGRMVVTLSPEAGFDAVMYVREGSCAASEVECEDSGLGGDPESVEIWVTQGTTYYVVVDGYSSNAGAFTLGATVQPAMPGDTCPGEAAVWSGTGPYTWFATGDTASRPDNYGGSGCGSTAGDVVYALTAPVTGTMSVEVNGFDSELFLSTTCGGYDLVCNDDAGSSSAETFDIQVTSGTTYYLVIDGYSSSAEGTYSVTASVAEPPANDVCPGADLTFSGNTATISGTTNGSAHDYAGSCGSIGGYAPELVYHFVAPTTGSYTVTLDTTSSSYDSVLYVRSGSCTGSEVDCADDHASGSGETLTFNATANADYWVFVDGYGGKSGDFTLTVSHN